MERAGLEPATSGLQSSARARGRSRDGRGLHARAGLLSAGLRELPGVVGVFRRPRAGCMRDGFVVLLRNNRPESQRRSAFAASRSGSDLYAGLVGGPTGHASQQWRAHSAAAAASSAAPSSQARVNASAVSAWRHSASRVSASACRVGNRTAPVWVWILEAAPSRVAAWVWSPRAATIAAPPWRQ